MPGSRVRDKSMPGRKSQGKFCVGENVCEINSVWEKKGRMEWYEWYEWLEGQQLSCD